MRASTQPAESLQLDYNRLGQQIVVVQQRQEDGYRGNCEHDLDAEFEVAGGDEGQEGGGGQCLIGARVITLVAMISLFVANL